ncbi:MAG: histidinol dehydrogenase [Bacteroidales bacterium]|nr:histidinol dehydrogenase [Candidatus Sodaliphilus fimicaballi]
MDVVRFPNRNEWPALMQRAAVVDDGAKAVVAGIIAQVRQQGDEALRDFARRFDHVELAQLAVSPQEFDEAALLVSDELKSSIAMAKQNIEKFHAAQRMEDITVETVPGVTCTQRAVAIPSVGLYIPGGNSPLFSTVLMLAVPAKLAGCGKVVMCTPAGKDGKVHPAILYAAQLCGVDAVYKIGGAQAVAAMAYGTETVPRVYKIFGPGNRWVMEAKMQVNTAGVAIDMPAGPSEVMIVADGSACATHVASDFLSQAEHGPDSQSILLTTSSELAEQLPVVTEQLLSMLPRREMMERSLSHSHIVLLHDDDEMMEFANAYAPEHLIINHSECNKLAAMVVNAGSVFLGPYSPESAGDYASGTNHTLPTSGYATAYSGVNLDSFIKKITFQRLTQEGIQTIGPVVMAMAEAEDLMAHRLAVAVRVGKE